MAIDDTADNEAAPGRGLGEIGRARAAIAALETSLRVSQVGAEMTDADRQVLRGWPGWGPLAKALAPSPEGTWAQLQGQLLGMLSPHEYEEGRLATPNAFYTPPVLAEGMTQLLADLGFDGGRVLEPGCGAGAFLGHTPPEGVSIDWIGVERDPSTARIAALLHPKATVRNSSLEDMALPPVDAVLGNVPFEDVRVHEPNPQVPRVVTTNLHNYAIWRSVDALKPGGIAVLITSRYTLDSGSPHARAALARQADLLGAIRLPNGALAEGGTQALVDVLVLRKRRPGEPEPEQVDEVPWVQSVQHPGLPDGQRINQVFHDHPEWVLGTLLEDRAPAYGRTVRVDAAEGTDLAAEFARAASQIVASAQDQGRVWQVARHDPAAALAEVPLADAEGRKEGSFHIVDGAAHQVVGGKLTPVMVQDHKASKAATDAARAAARARGEDPTAVDEVRVDRGPLSGKALAELTALVDLRDTTLELLEAEADHSRPDADIEPLRQQLNTRYDSYVAQFGRLNRATITASTTPAKAPGPGEDSADEQTGLPKITRKRPQMGGFAADPDYPAVLALEDWDDAANDGEKAAIFHTRLNKPRPRIERAESPEHALAVCLDERGEVDFDRIAALLDTPADQVLDQLGELVFEDPVTMRWQAREDYLCGDVADKLDQARLAAEHSPQRFGRNVTALEGVQPTPLTPEQITASLGAPWIPPEIIEHFCAEVLDERVSVAYTPELAQFELTRRSAQRSVASTSEFGTSRIDGLRLVELALEGKTPKIKDETPDDKKVVNQGETQAAQTKQQALATRFAEWVWDDPQRAERLAALYNRTFNSYVNRHYDGEHLTFPGLSAEFEPYPHQRQMVHRAIANPTALCGYAVGGGKTGIMFMQAMKLRELGLASKPMIIVPNHLLEQVARDGKRWFPGAKILMADERQLGKRNDLAQRKLFAARCATGDWDAVVMTHSAFESLPVGKDTQATYIAEHTADLEDALRAKGGKESKQTKALARALKREQATLKDNLAAERADNGVTFEMLGVDYLMVDEAHYFKNLHLRASDREISLPRGSNRATDLDNKLAYLRRTNPTGRVATFFTGTPLSNNLVEIYVMQHYLQPERLQQMGVHHLDAWLRTFIRCEARLEVGTDGVSFRMKNRPVAFRNPPELMGAFNAVADVRSQQDLGLARPKARYENITTPATTAQSDFIADIARRIDALPTTPAEVDNMLKVCSDGRKAALDPELVGLDDPEPGKVEAVVSNMAAIYHRTKNLQFPNGKVGGLQLGFLDLGTPNPEAGDQVYGKIRDGLITEGVPANGVRFIHEATTTAQKAALFAQARSGEVAVLLGSTDKMGVGTNVQDLIVALHHVDAPWRPADVEQRDGRGLRVGNQMLALDLPVEVFKYITEGSFDSYMWQTLERKSWFIAQLFSGSPSREEIEIDLDETVMAASEAKALATGNPLLLEHAEAKQELTRLQSDATSHTRTQRALESQITTWQQQQDILRAQIRVANSLAAEVADQPATWTYGGATLASDKVNEVLGELLREQITQPHRTHTRLSYRDVSISLNARQQLSSWQLEARLNYGSSGEVTLKKEWLSAPNQYWRIAKAITDRIDHASDRAAELQDHVDELDQRLERGRGQLGKPFPQAEELAAARTKLAAIEARMGEDDAAAEPPAEETAEQAAAEDEIPDITEIPGLVEAATRDDDVQVFVGEQHLSDQQRSFIKRVRSGGFGADAEPEQAPEVVNGEVATPTDASADGATEAAAEGDTAASSTEEPAPSAQAAVQPESSAPEDTSGVAEPEVTTVPEDASAAPAAPMVPAHSVAAALAWYDAGFSVIQVDDTHGTKAPMGKWTQYQQERASRDQVKAWFRDGHAGIGLVCGAVSGHAELIEFEGRAVEEGLVDEFRDRMAAGGHTELYRRVVEQGTVVRSPSGGLHMLVRVEGGVEGNRKLASRPARDDELTSDERQRVTDKGVWPSRVLAETRGERGMVVAAGSHGGTHESGNPWELITGSPDTVPTLTADERDLLHVVLRSLDQTPAPDPLPEPAPAASTAQGLAPGQDFNERGTWSEVLEPHGWTRVRTEGERTYWRRPGKNLGVSAVTGGSAGDYLWVFSTSTELPSETALSKWRTYAMLEHAGDFSAAASALRRDGYGSPLPREERVLTLRFRQETGVLLLGTDGRTDNFGEVFDQIKSSGFQPGNWLYSRAIDNGTDTPGAWYIRNTRGKPASETVVRRMATTVEQLSRRDFEVVVDINPDDLAPQVLRRRLTMRSQLQTLGVASITTPDAAAEQPAPTNELVAGDEPLQAGDHQRAELDETATAEHSAEQDGDDLVDEVRQEVSEEPIEQAAVEPEPDQPTQVSPAPPERAAPQPQQEDLFSLAPEPAPAPQPEPDPEPEPATDQAPDVSPAAPVLTEPEQESSLAEPEPAAAGDLDSAPPPAPTAEDNPATAASAAPQRQLVLHHSQQHGLLLYGTRPTDAIRETLQLARLQGHAVGNWGWDPSAVTPEGTQGAWRIPDSQDRLATPVTVRVLHSAAHALRGTGIDVRVDIDPTDATEQAQQLLDAPPPAAAPEATGPVARRWSEAEHQKWDTVRKIEGSDRSGITVVEAAEIDGRWSLRAQTLIGGHHLDVRISLRDEERAANLARTITTKPQTLPRLARNAVVLGEADALLDGQPLPATGTAQALRERLAEPGPYAQHDRGGTRSTATRAASAALSSPSSEATQPSRSTAPNPPPRRTTSPAAAPAANTAMTAHSRTL